MPSKKFRKKNGYMNHLATFTLVVDSGRSNE
jgi:hypothetical protein